MPGSTARRPLIMHIVYSFNVGGLENGIVNLINGLPRSAFDHAILALTDCNPEFSQRIARSDIQLFSLHKPPGHGWKVFRAAWRIFRQQQPAIVHTRNLAALELQIPAAAAGVTVRVHGEHGWSADDPKGERRKSRLIRKAYRPLVTQYVTVSRELETYLKEAIGVSAERVVCIRNGVDDRTFTPAEERGESRDSSSEFVIGTVGRLDRVKGHAVLIDAVTHIIDQGMLGDERILVRIVGDGPLRTELESLVAKRKLSDIIQFAGVQHDIPEIMRQFDLFVLPSHAEGISNTVLEAMASGLPVVATAVGGNLELVESGETGMLVPADDPRALASAIMSYVRSASLCKAHGRRGRERVEAELGMQSMLRQYKELYSRLLSTGR